MPDIITLLPDNIANQIAAGEVIQRPASVVKELLENAIDAKSTEIKLIIKDAGKRLIQVIDNGVGMSETDARICFEKHATSKIKSVDDLFKIITKGFRGEALASIAAIAQVELKTRQATEVMATEIRIEGSALKYQEPCQAPIGTSVAVKNLFYNVPARRNFLKSNNVETKHIIEEFNRVALAHPDIGFSLFNNDYQLYQVAPSNLRKRIVGIFGENYNQRLVPLSEKTDYLKISGFIGKPEFAKKTRGEQYIFVNKRFIKSNYLNHAIYAAFEDILPKDKYPLFVLFLEIDPARIDINVHPTKHEIKFEDERLVYTFVNAATRHALAQFSVSPTLDFDQEDHFNQMGTFGQKNEQFKPEESAMNLSNSDFPFSEKEKRNKQSGIKQDNNLKHWQDLYKTEKPQTATYTIPGRNDVPLIPDDDEDAGISKPFQLHNKYIISPIRSGFIMVDQQAAHERILFEQYLNSMNARNKMGQKQLFPVTVELQADDARLLEEILEDVNLLGFDIQEFGKNTFVIHSTPMDLIEGNEKEMIEELIEQYKNSVQVSKLSKRDALAKTMAQSSSIKHGKPLKTEEMKSLIDKLFACENPYKTPGGKKTFVKYNILDIDKEFEKG